MRLATFNAEWLFNGNNDQSPWTSPEAAEKHLVEVAGAVATVNADMMGFQEVQNCDMLIRLITHLENQGVQGYKPYLIQGTDTATGQNVGLITRIDPVTALTRSENRVAYPIAGNTCGSTSASGTSAVSKHFIAKFLIKNKAYTMFNHHFLAYPTDAARCVQREAQASVMRGLINSALAANDEVVVFGDYNDYSDKVPDVANDKPTSRVMRILRDGLLSTSKGVLDKWESLNLTNADNLTLASLSLNNADTDPTLVEVSTLVAQNLRYTSAYDVTKLSQIDHLLVSKGIATNMVAAGVSHIYPRETVSDHWPFWVDVNTP